MKVTELTAILEIAGHPNGKDIPRYLTALDNLKKGQIGNYPVLAVAYINPNEAPCRVPGFGHNYRCGNDCICDVQPYSVLRYFGLRFWVEGDFPLDLLTTVKLTEYARLDICGKERSYEPGHLSLKEIKAA